MDSYYVYAYRDQDGDVVYIGKGVKGRAWHVGYMKGDTKERHEWKEIQLNQGRLPCDWVSIEARNLTETEAFALETKLIELYRPPLNRAKNPDHKSSKIVEEGLGFAKLLREMGYSYKNIAHLVGGSSMTIHRALNGGFKGVN